MKSPTILRYDEAMIRHELRHQPFAHDLYLPPAPGPYPVIFLTPILGRVVFLEDLFFEKIWARFFASNGLAVCIIHRPIFEFEQTEELEQLGQYVETSLHRNRKVFESVCSLPEIDSSRCGTFGMSFGGIINTLWASEEESFKAHIFALPGGNLPEIFVTSEDPLMRSHLKGAMKKTGLDINSLKERLTNIFKRDPLYCASKIEKEKILLVLAVFDRVVRYRLGKDLRKVMKTPETIFLPLGHYLSLLAIPFLKPRALRFYRDKFSIRLG